MRATHPNWTCRIDGGLLICRGPLTPTPISATYLAIVRYRAATWPEVHVPGDQLQPLEPGGKIPHTYGPGEPCLFYPSRTCWRSDMKLSHTIIPWLSLWLTFYEMWRATGEWYGGGISHGPVKLSEPAA
jgi:hypothetical protein